MPKFLSRSDLGRALWTFRREFAWVGVFSFFANLLLLAPTLYMLQIFDRVMLSQNEFTLIALTLITTFFFGVMAFAEWVRSRLLVRSSVRFDNFLNSRIFEASYEANLASGKGNPMQAFQDLTNLRQFLTGNGVFVVFDLPWTPIYLAVLFMMHPVLGWASVGFTVLQAVLAWVGHRATSGLHEKSMEGVVASNGFVNAKLRNAETVLAMGMQGTLRSRWLGIHGAQMQSHAQAQRVALRVQSLTRFFQYAQQSLILSVGALLAIQGEISAGAMVASNALMFNALRPITVLVGSWKQFLDARTAFDRTEMLLEEHPVREATHRADQVRGQLTLVNLQASVPGRKQPILKGLNVEFKAGEVVAIVGPSGAGKSTLARCLLGIWPDVTGQVMLDGHDIREWSRDDLGPHIGYLPQDIEMFDGTLAENIARFAEMDSAKVIEAATRTGIHEMILRFPKGYDTHMGEAGSLFSGGQRQRVGLARAVYGNPKLVVLDEPNANLDDAGVSALLKTVAELRAGGATVFMVVHQANLLSVADRVLVMNDGVITQFGPVAPARTPA